MKLVLFGDIEHWERAVGLVTTYRPDIAIAGLCALDLEGCRDSGVTFTLREVMNLYQTKQIDGVVNLQSENPYYFNLLKQLGITELYMIPHTLYCRQELGEDLTGDAIVRSCREALPELMQLEVHLADHCNLNCKGCSHFSNLVPDAVFADKEQFKRDVLRLTHYFSQIHNFFLLGGEPLLNPDIRDFIDIVRGAFPYTNLILVTNGLLLPSLDEQLLHCFRENRVHISISDYSILDRGKIIAVVQKYALSAELREGKECFSKYLNPKGDSDKMAVFHDCIRKNCTFLAHGKIAACCQPFTVHYFNEYFGEHLPEDEGIDLYEEGLDGWEIQNRLITPLESCRFCAADVPFDWELSKAPFSKEDWCV